MAIKQIHRFYAAPTVQNAFTEVWTIILGSMKLIAKLFSISVFKWAIQWNLDITKGQGTGDDIYSLL